MMKIYTIYGLIRIFIYNMQINYVGKIHELYNNGYYIIHVSHAMYYGLIIYNLSISCKVLWLLYTYNDNHNT